SPPVMRLFCALGVLGCLLAGLAALAGPGDAPPAAAPRLLPDDVQDVVFFHPARPYLLRLHVQRDGRPLREAWQRYLDDLFRYLDADGDGVLDRKELEHTPSAGQLLRQLQGADNVEPEPPPDFAEVDVAPADGKITQAELENYYHHQN